MELKKEIDKIIEIESQIDKLYEKVSNAEWDGEKEKLKENLSYIRFLSEIEEEKIEKLNVDEELFTEIVYLLNGDNYLQLLFSIDEEYGPIYKTNLDNLSETYCFLYHDIKYCDKRIKPTLNAYLCNTRSHPLIKRLFYKIIGSYYQNIENPPLGFDAYVIHIMDKLINKGGKELLIYQRENAIALLYADVYTQLESAFLEKSTKEYKKDKDIKDFLIELKRYVSFANPNLEKYLIKSEDSYTNPNTIQIPRNCKGTNRKVYKQIRKITAQTDINELIDFFSRKEPIVTLAHHTYYKLYMKSRLMYLEDDMINNFYIVATNYLKRKKSANAILEAIEEEIEERMEKRKQKRKAK